MSTPMWAACTKQAYRVMRKYQRFEGQRGDGYQAGRCPGRFIDPELCLPAAWAAWGRAVQVDSAVDHLARAESRQLRFGVLEGPFVTVRYKHPVAYWQQKRKAWGARRAVR